MHRVPYPSLSTLVDSMLCISWAYPMQWGLSIERFWCSCFPFLWWNFKPSPQYVTCHPRACLSFWCKYMRTFTPIITFVYFSHFIFHIPFLASTLTRISLTIMCEDAMLQHALQDCWYGGSCNRLPTHEKDRNWKGIPWHSPKQNPRLEKIQANDVSQSLNAIMFLSHL